jgi:hypothetical protein
MSTYARFENGENNQNVSNSQKPINQLKYGLARAEILLSLIIIIPDAILIFAIGSVNSHLLDPFPCGHGLGVLVGLLGLISAGFEFGSHRLNSGKKCLKVAHFLMCIVCIVADFILIVFACICINTLDKVPNRHRNIFGLDENEGMDDYEYRSIKRPLSAIIAFAFTHGNY